MKENLREVIIIRLHHTPRLTTTTILHHSLSLILSSKDFYPKKIWLKMYQTFANTVSLSHLCTSSIFNYEIVWNPNNTYYSHNATFTNTLGFDFTTIFYNTSSSRQSPPRGDHQQCFSNSILFSMWRLFTCMMFLLFSSISAVVFQKKKKVPKLRLSEIFLQ